MTSLYSFSISIFFYETEHSSLVMNNSSKRDWHATLLLFRNMLQLALNIRKLHLDLALGLRQHLNLGIGLSADRVAVESLSAPYDASPQPDSSKTVSRGSAVCLDVDSTTHCRQW